MTTTPHDHHWLIESPKGNPTSRGVCKHCGAKGEFSNVLPEGGWRSQVAQHRAANGGPPVPPDLATHPRKDKPNTRRRTRKDQDSKGQPYREEQAWMWTARVTAGLTQANVADALDVSKYSVSNWENGRHRPNEATIAYYRSLIE